MKYHIENPDIARSIVLKRTIESKKSIIKMLQNSDRNFKKLRELVDEYISCQATADLLKGYMLDMEGNDLTKEQFSERIYKQEEERKNI